MIYDHAVLIDSDAFIGLQIKQDAHHKKARDTFEHIQQSRLWPVVTNYVIAETTNLLSRRYSMEEAKRFLKIAQTLPLIIIDESLHLTTLALFQTQTRSKTSLIDISNVVVMQHFAIPTIFSFDQMYEQDFNLSMMSPAKNL